MKKNIKKNIKAYSLFNGREYKEIFPTINVMGEPQDFFLKCNAYQITIPVTKRDIEELDLFEEAVLRLLHVEPVRPTAKEIAEMLCLDEGLINLIISRLTENEWIERQSWALTDKGERFVSGLDKVDDDAFITGYVFALNDGVILPYIHLEDKLTPTYAEEDDEQGEDDEEDDDQGEEDDDQIEDDEYDDDQGEDGAAGKTKESDDIKLPYLKAEFGPEARRSKVVGAELSQDGNRVTPKQRDLERALRNHNLAARNRASLKRVDFKHGNNISVNFAYKIYLHMKAAIQKGAADYILVTDGVNVHVDSVKKLIEDRFGNFLNLVRQSAASPQKINVADDDKKGTDGDKKYTVVKLWKDIVKLNKRYNLCEPQQSLSSDEETELKAKQKEFRVNCHDAISWALYLEAIANEHKITPLIDLYLSRSEVGKNHIIELAEKAGLKKTAALEKLIRGVNNKKIKKMYATQTPDLRSGLVCAILGCEDENDPPFSLILREEQNFTEILAQMNAERNDAEHSVDRKKFDHIQNAKYLRAVKVALKRLTPNYSYDEDFEIVEADERDASQARLDARLKLPTLILECYDIMDKNLRDAWIALAFGKDLIRDPYKTVSAMYRILQSTLLVDLGTIEKNPDLEPKDIKDALKKAGFSDDALLNVTDIYLKNTLKGINETLGASAAVYLYYRFARLNDPNEIARVKDTAILLADTTAKLTYMRGHVVNITLSTSLEELESLRNDLARLTRWILRYDTTK